MEKEKDRDLFSVNIGEYRGEKPIEVIYRTGTAAQAVEQLPTKEPIRVNIQGVISTPFDWLEKRISTVDPMKANVCVNRDAMTITLTVEEADAYHRGVVKGSVEFSEVFAKLGINNEKQAFSPQRLGQLLRLNRGIFEDKEVCMKLVSALKNFVANAKVEIQKQRDPSGSVAEVYRQQVESNLPKSFTVNIPIFKGTGKTAIEVEFDHYISDGEVLLQLVSPGANEMAETYRDSCLDEVLNKIREIAPDIAILEV